MFEGLQAGSLRRKGGEDVQGLESDFGKLLLVKGENPYLGHFQEYITFYGKMEAN